jgi:hypothetical protein
MLRPFKNYYRDFVQWSLELKFDTHISVVKNDLPGYITVDWEHPKNFGKGLLYPVVKIKGYRRKNIIHFLGFVDNLYSGHVSTHPNTVFP